KLTTGGNPARMAPAWMVGNRKRPPGLYEEGESRVRIRPHGRDHQRGHHHNRRLRWGRWGGTGEVTGERFQVQFWPFPTSPSDSAFPRGIKHARHDSSRETPARIFSGYMGALLVGKVGKSPRPCWRRAQDFSPPVSPVAPHRWGNSSYREERVEP